MAYSEKENIQYTREELEAKLTGKEKRFCEEYVNRKKEKLKSMIG